MAHTPPCLPFLSVLLLLSSTLSYSFYFSNYRDLLTISHSLTSRVATLRAERGDLEGAERARTLAHKLDREIGLGFYKFAWKVGWDYVKNYGGRSGKEAALETVGGGVSDLNELLGVLCELSQIDSDSDRVTWLSQNYKNAIRVSKLLFARTLQVFRLPGTLRGIVEMLQEEMVEGDLLRDCLELGADDVKGLIQLVKAIALLYSSVSSKIEL